MKSPPSPAIIYMEVRSVFFELENPITEIIGVDHIEWKAQKCKVLPRDYSALAFRIKGSGHICYNETNISVSTNNILYLPQNIGYSAEYSDTELIVIHFKTQNADQVTEVFSFENTEKIYKLFLEALTIWENKKTGYKIMTISILYKILATVYKETHNHSLPQAFINAVSLINSNYKDNSLSIKQICLEAEISETYFRRLFSEYYKKTPVAYINGLRIEYARNLIANGMSIEAAAYSTGFNDPKYFSRVIKKHFNCTPRELKSYGK